MKYHYCVQSRQLESSSIEDSSSYSSKFEPREFKDSLEIITLQRESNNNFQKKHLSWRMK